MNQCDGCRAGLPFNEYGSHYDPESLRRTGYANSFGCTKDRYVGTSAHYWAIADEPGDWPPQNNPHYDREL